MAVSSGMRQPASVTYWPFRGSGGTHALNLMSPRRVPSYRQREAKDAASPPPTPACGCGSWAVELVLAHGLRDVNGAGLLFGLGLLLFFRF